MVSVAAVCGWMSAVINRGGGGVMHVREAFFGGGGGCITTKSLLQFIWRWRVLFVGCRGEDRGRTITQDALPITPTVWPSLGLIVICASSILMSFINQSFIYLFIWEQNNGNVPEGSRVLMDMSVALLLFAYRMPVTVSRFPFVIKNYPIDISLTNKKYSKPFSHLNSCSRALDRSESTSL